MKIDKTDEKIMNELIKNSKITLRNLAKKTQTSFVTVMNRVKHMEREGIIKGYSAKIDYEKLGFGVNVIIEVRISRGKLIELERRISQFPNVYTVYDTTGEFDATVIGRFKSTRSMDNFLKKIQTFDFVERTDTRLVLNTIKEENMKISN